MVGESAEAREQWAVQVVEAPEEERREQHDHDEQQLQEPVQAQGPAHPVGDAAAEEAAQREAAEVAGQDGRDGLRRVAEDEDQLARPHDLVDEARRARQQEDEQDGGPGQADGLGDGWGAREERVQELGRHRAKGQPGCPDRDPTQGIDGQARRQLAHPEADADGVADDGQAHEPDGAGHERDHDDRKEAWQTRPHRHGPLHEPRADQAQEGEGDARLDDPAARLADGELEAGQRSDGHHERSGVGGERHDESDHHTSGQAGARREGSGARPS